MTVPLVVGFDLDMTLIDSRPGIKHVYDLLAAETGVEIDSELVVSRLGPPLAGELANWFPAAQVPEMVDRYRAHYVQHAVEPSLPLPGARDALLAVRELGGRTVVVTSKIASSAQRHIDHLDLAVDVVHGDLFSDAKAAALVQEHASIYVGDHVHDVRGALAAGATSVGVTTGPCNGLELERAGADVVLHSLVDFRGWLHGH